MKRVLFIGHEASRTGAPIILLHLIKWLKENRGIEAELWLVRGGPLESDYRKYAKTTVIWHFDANRWRADARRLFIHRLMHGIGMCIEFLEVFGSRIHIYFLLRRAAKEGVDCVYLNSIGSTRLMSRVRKLGCPVVLHVHELAFGMNEPYHMTYLSEMQRFIDMYIVPSIPVLEHFKEAYDIPAEQMFLVPEGVHDPLLHDPLPNGDAVRAALGIPADACVVGMAGTIEWRKGIDLFIRLSRMLLKARPDIHMIWIGGHTNPTAFQKYGYAMYHIENEPRIHFTKELEDPLDSIAAIDIFALTSREDPYPLVVLEAGLMKKPVICFEASGGTPYFAAKGAGIKVPYQDVHAMGEVILDLVQNAERRKELGEMMRTVILRDSTVEIMGNNIHHALVDLAATKAALK